MRNIKLNKGEADTSIMNLLQERGTFVVVFFTDSGVASVLAQSRIKYTFLRCALLRLALSKKSSLRTVRGLGV